ncbi:MAG: hypothetical protein IKT40_09040 [Bacilli bacterium]|nr:hypothetical protein [Bacilli bacterium]
MKKIYIKESQLELISGLNNKDEEVTFEEFFINIKDFLKGILQKPHETNPSELFTNRGITKNELISKLKDINLIKSEEKIDERPRVEGGKKVAIHTIKYNVLKNRFKDKLKCLYKDIFVESYNPQVFSDTSKVIEDILSMDSDNAYHNRGGFDKTIVSEDGEGGGATSCGSVMQGGGSNPSAGQYDVPFKNVQRRDFWKPALKRNKDEKNNSISMNRLS